MCGTGSKMLKPKHYIKIRQKHVNLQGMPKVNYLGNEKHASSGESQNEMCFYELSSYTTWEKLRVCMGLSFKGFS